MPPFISRLGGRPVRSWNTFRYTTAAVVRLLRDRWHSTAISAAGMDRSYLLEIPLGWGANVPIVRIVGETSTAVALGIEHSDLDLGQGAALRRKERSRSTSERAVPNTSLQIS